MIILGLTGSIAMGKSEASKMFRRLGVPVFDADAAVHQIMAPGRPVVAEVEQAFPGVTNAGAIDRAALGARVFGQRDELRKLEAIIHPRVAQMQRHFLAGAARRRLALVVLDIPLLFEGRGEERCDFAATVTAPAFLQRQRVLARDTMTAEKFENILRQQVPDAVKRQRADFVLPTGLGRRYTRNRIAALIASMRLRKGRIWPPRGRPFRRPGRHPCRRPVHARNRPRH